jgi:hypothetical protein
MIMEARKSEDMGIILFLHDEASHKMDTISVDQSSRTGYGYSQCSVY